MATEGENSVVEGNDRNRRFFHTRTSNKRRKNTIKGLRGDDGVQYDSPKGIEEMVVDYFRRIFRTQRVLSNAVQKVIRAVSQRVTPEMNEVLLQPYSTKEITMVFFQMHTSKSPGPDGMSPLFYQ